MKYGIIPVRGVRYMERIIDGKTPTHHQGYRDILEFGLYGRLLSRLYELFPREQVKVVIQDDLFANQEAVTGDIQRYMGLTEMALPDLNERPQASIYSLPRLKVLHYRTPHVYRYDSGRTKTIDIPQSERTAHGRFVNRVVGAIDRRVMQKLFANKPPELPERLRQRLQTYYAEDLELTEKLTGFDLSAWKAQP